MANKTTRNDGDVHAFLADVAHDRRREDAQAVLALMTDVAGVAPAMWGTSIVGFGDVHHTYASGREVDYFPIGLSPRKQSLTIYLSDGFDNHQDLLARLGPHTTSVSCLYVKRLDDLDEDVLRALLQASWTAQTT